MSTVVLAHGYLGFSKIGPFEYFNGVADDLRKKCRVGVLTPQVSPIGSIRERSVSLQQQIAATFRNERVHIIAHSMGGLDARHLVSPNGLNRSDLVASLTTVSTPHRGSPAADAALGLINEITDTDAAQLLDKLWKRDAKRPQQLLAGLAADLKGHVEALLKDLGVERTESTEIAIGKIKNTLKEAGHYIRSLFTVKDEGLRELTTDYVARQFNSEFKDSPDVRYFSYAGVSGPGEQDILPSVLYLPYLIILWREGRNDGLVSVDSAQWGEFQGEISANHAEEIGHDLSKINRLKKLITRQGFNHLEFYRRIVDGLIKPLM